jgi:two-component system sensor histidine kinase/response regulator
VRSGRLELSPERADLSALCEHIVEEFELPEGERRVDMTFTGDTFGEWDADRLSQVISNLVGNALQHGRADEGVSLKVDGSEADRVTIAIRNGGTIPADVQANIFHPFNFTHFRRDGGKGLGLGLYIAKELVRSHRGEMSVCSDTTDHTVFTIHLPRHFVHGPLDEPAQAEKQWVF